MGSASIALEVFVSRTLLVSVGQHLRDFWQSKMTLVECPANGKQEVAADLASLAGRTRAREA